MLFIRVLNGDMSFLDWLKFKYAVYPALLGIGFIIVSCDEARYAMFAKSATGTVTKFRDDGKFEYTFKGSDGESRTGKCYPPDNVSIGPGSVVQVQYLGTGHYDSRLRRGINWGLMAPWIMAFVVIGIAIVKFSVEYRDHERRSRAAESDYGLTPTRSRSARKK